MVKMVKCIHRTKNHLKSVSMTVPRFYGLVSRTTKAWLSYIVRIADIGLRKSDHTRDDCSSLKLLCFAPIIGDFYGMRTRLRVLSI